MSGGKGGVPSASSVNSASSGGRWPGDDWATGLAFVDKADEPRDDGETFFPHSIELPAALRFTGVAADVEPSSFASGSGDGAGSRAGVGIVAGFAIPLLLVAPLVL